MKIGEREETRELERERERERENRRIGGKRLVE